MRTVPDSELQARLLREILEVNEKRRKLEEHLRIADVRSKLLIDSAARKDIEAHKNRHVVAEVASVTVPSKFDREARQ